MQICSRLLEVKSRNKPKVVNRISKINSDLKHMHDKSFAELTAASRLKIYGENIL